jgi:hypothetical protein
VKTGGHGLAYPAWGQWLMVLLVMLMPLQNAGAACVAMPRLAGAAGGTVAAVGSMIYATIASEPLHECCAHHGSGGGDRTCNVHCLAAPALFRAFQSTGLTTARSSALPETAKLAFSALFSPELRPPILS